MKHSSSIALFSSCCFTVCSGFTTPSSSIARNRPTTAVPPLWLYREPDGYRDPLGSEWARHRKHQQQQQHHRGDNRGSSSTRTSPNHNNNNHSPSNKNHNKYSNGQSPPPFRHGARNYVANHAQTTDYVHKPDVISQVTADPLIRPWTHPVKQKHQTNKNGHSAAIPPPEHHVPYDDPWAQYMTVQEETVSDPTEVTKPRLGHTAPVQPVLTRQERMAAAYGNLCRDDVTRVAPHAIDEYMTVADDEEPTFKVIDAEIDWDDDEHDWPDDGTETQVPHAEVIGGYTSTPSSSSSSTAAASSTITDAEIVAEEEQQQEEEEEEQTTQEYYDRQMDNAPDMANHNGFSANHNGFSSSHNGFSTTTSQHGFSAAQMEELAEAWARMTYNDKTFTNNGQTQPSTPPMRNGFSTEHTASRPTPTNGPSMDELAEAWARMTHNGQYQHPYYQQNNGQSQASGPASPSMEELAEAWVRMTHEKKDSSSSTTPQASWASPAPAPASWTPPSPAAADTNYNHNVAPPASWTPPSPHPAGPVLVDDQPVENGGSTVHSRMRDLAKEWAEMSVEQEDPNNRRPPPANLYERLKVQAPPPPPPPPPAATETTSAASTATAPTMEDLAEAWARMTIEEADPNNNRPTMPSTMDDLAEAWARMTLLEQMEQEGATTAVSSTGTIPSVEAHRDGPTVNGSTLLQNTPYFAETAVMEAPPPPPPSVDETIMQQKLRMEQQTRDEQTRQALVDQVTDAILNNLKSIIEQQARIAVERNNVGSLEDLAALLIAQNQPRNQEQSIYSDTAARPSFVDTSGRSFQPDPKM